jgi:catechol 2,3-dioxygenase-like lactoylglutathione lyase family enzyme
MIEGMPDLITKLVPILHVEDPDAERRFYEQLGLRTTYEGPEYPGFLAVGNDAVEFGLSRSPGADLAAPTVTWQLGVSDADAAIAVCERLGLSFQVVTERPREDWTYRVITVRSPSGMEVLLEEQARED